MGTNRPQRVAQLIQQEIGQLVTRGFKDPRIGFVTITGVKISPDLRSAIVYYSVLGDEKARKDTADGLTAAVGWVKRQLGPALKLRYTPDLRFVFDEAIERGDRIDRLLREVQAEERARKESPDEGPKT